MMARIQTTMINLVIIGSCISLAHCAVQKQRLDELRDVAVSDIVHHDILDAVGMETAEPPKKEYDPDLAKYLESFLEDAKSRNVVVPEHRLERLRVIKYVDQLSKDGGPGVVATCNRYFLKAKTLGGNKTTKWTTIEVLRADSADFVENEEVRLRMLIYHELFHCLMGRGHLPADLPPGIMSETLTKGSGQYYEEIWIKLVDDMFAYSDYCPVLDD